jgi:SIR2-like domain
MPIDLSKIPKKLVEAVKTERLIPFVGAGISAQSGFPFPSWRELLTRLKETALEQGGISANEGAEIESLFERGQYLMAAEELRFRLPVDEYESFLLDQFDPVDVLPAEVHRQLFRISPPLIVSTNYDRLLEDAFASRYERSPMVYTYKDAAFVQRLLQSGNRSGRPAIFKIHGSIADVEGIILSERDYRKLLYESPGYRLVLSALFLTHVVVFLGFSFGDPELRLLLEQHRESLKHRGQPDYILLEEGSANSVERRRLREDFGLQVISYEATRGHPEVHTFVSTLADFAAESREARL